MQELNLSRGYLSSVSPRIHFGIGTSTQIDEIMLEWTDGTHSKIEKSKVNTYNVIA